MTTCTNPEGHEAHMALNGECPWCGAGEPADLADARNTQVPLYGPEYEVSGRRVRNCRLCSTAFTALAVPLDGLDEHDRMHAALADDPDSEINAAALKIMRQMLCDHPEDQRQTSVYGAPGTGHVVRCLACGRVLEDTGRILEPWEVI